MSSCTTYYQLDDASLLALLRTHAPSTAIEIPQTIFDLVDALKSRIRAMTLTSCTSDRDVKLLRTCDNG